MKNKFRELKAYLVSRCTIKLQDKRMVMAKAYTYRTMEKNRKSKRKCVFVQVIFDKGAKVIQWENRTI